MTERSWSGIGKILTAAIAMAVIVAVFGTELVVRHGFSTRSRPTLIESAIARSVRHLATPAPMRGMKNPVALTPPVLAEGRAHWADHCAICHGNDGRGNTEMGRGMYPRPPDMRRMRTQNLSDGELFSIIRNGVPFTGMPAWGDAAGRDDSANWKLVHFIRHLPNVTPEEAAQMESLNPKSPEEWRQMEEAAAFLRGQAETSPQAIPSETQHDH